MPRITKAILEENNKLLRKEVKDLKIRLTLSDKMVRFYGEAYTHPNVVMTIALEKVTEAVAHVVSDLKTRTPR